MSHLLRLKNVTIPSKIQLAFSQVHSNKLVSTKDISHRSDFRDRMREGKWNLQPVIISQSDFIPKTMTSHLMRNKKDSALGVKYTEGDKITNMEGAMHTFLTPICPITILGDYAYKYGHTIVRLPKNEGRSVILSAAVQPDFECSGTDEVIMRIAEVQQNPVLGYELPPDCEPLWNQCQNNQQIFGQELNRYEESLRKHLVYSLTKDHRLPAFRDIQDSVLTYSDAVDTLEHMIQFDKDINFIEVLSNRFVRLCGHVLSLEVLFMIYVQQLINEFSVLEQALPHGYVYTINPPAIFATQIGGDENVNILNRLQILAFLYLRRNSSFENLKIIGFSNYCDKGALQLLQHVFFDKMVVEREALFKKGSYSVTNDYALVLHNNSDAFGQNIQTEGASSLDGVIGRYSDASCHLHREREDLINIVI